MNKDRRRDLGKSGMTFIGSAALALTVTGCVAVDDDTSSLASNAVSLADLCTPATMTGVAATVDATKVTVGKIANINGPTFEAGVNFTAATDAMPAFCQVTGSFVTNPETSSTANFLATFPEDWNGKYLQIGCGGHCGTFAVSNPASPLITITNQGTPGQIIRKGYATFATDEGHTSMDAGSWAIKGPGEIDQDKLDDLLYRAHKVLAPMGKQFTRALYAGGQTTLPAISRSYFSGCSGGGRDALVAASYFPEQFDGIVAGSPYKMTTAFQNAGTGIATLRSSDARISAGHIAVLNKFVTAQCDAIDGVKDELIQNPAACNFAPERDLPKCANGQSSDQCFTSGQIATVSAAITAVTDENGSVVHPGYAVSNMLDGFQPPTPAADPNAEQPWPSDQARGGLYGLAEATIRIFANRNDPDFATRRIFSFREGQTAGDPALQTVVPSSEVEKLLRALRMGIGHFPENTDSLIAQNRKLLIWHNFSDQLLSPYMSTEYYKALAARHGGFENLQKNVRLFALPGTAHCSGGGAPTGPGSFDALGAIENWVEKGIAPDALTATLYQPTPYGVDFAKPLGRTMPLCAFPAMAKYGGNGDINDAANWSCPAGDARMLGVGESGRRAGVVK